MSGYVWVLYLVRALDTSSSAGKKPLSWMWQIIVTNHYVLFLADSKPSVMHMWCSLVLHLLLYVVTCLRKFYSILFLYIFLAELIETWTVQSANRGDKPGNLPDCDYSFYGRRKPFKVDYWPCTCFTTMCRLFCVCLCFNPFVCHFGTKWHNCRNVQ